MKKVNTVLLILFLFSVTSIAVAQQSKKLRLVVLTGIEADPDDTQSLIRFLTYCNEWDVEGLIATTSIHQLTRVAPESILKVLRAYKKVQPNLLRHEKGYPGYDELKAKVKQGLPVYGMSGVGDGKNSEGSEWIIKVLEKNDDRLVWISVWGGTNALAQAPLENKQYKEGDRSRKTV